MQHVVIGLKWNSKRRCYQVAIDCRLSISSLVTGNKYMPKPQMGSCGLISCSGSLHWAGRGQISWKSAEYHCNPPNICRIFHWIFFPSCWAPSLFAAKLFTGYVWYSVHASSQNITMTLQLLFWKNVIFLTWLPKREGGMTKFGKCLDFLFFFTMLSLLQSWPVLDWKTRGNTQLAQSLIG